MAWELKSDDAFWQSSTLIYLGNNTWTHPGGGESLLLQISDPAIAIRGIRLKYEWGNIPEGTPNPYNDAIAGVTSNGTKVYIGVTEAGSGVEVELLPPLNEYFVSIEAQFYFSGWYAGIRNIKDIYVDISPTNDRLYKLDSFEEQTVYVPDTYLNPPQFGRPPSSGQPYNPGAPFNWQGYQPTSFGSDTVSRPTGGSRNNTNTNNRPPNNNVNLFTGDLTESEINRLLEWIHANGVSGVQL